MKLGGSVKICIVLGINLISYDSSGFHKLLNTVCLYSKY